MKLVKIDETRSGQIRKLNDNNKLFIIGERCAEQIPFYYGWNITWLESGYGDIMKDFHNIRINEGRNIQEYGISDSDIVGFLGITHEWNKEGKLIEIPREEFEEDDIVEIELKSYDGEGEYRLENRLEVILLKSEDLYRHLYLNYLRTTLTTSNGNIAWNKGKPVKKGILGVNYEYVNNKIKGEK